MADIALPLHLTTILQYIINQKVNTTIMDISNKVTLLKEQLNSFDRQERDKALTALHRFIEQGKWQTAPATLAHNLHCHTFFSYNGYGFSPSYIVWLAKQSGYFAVGCVDFDVLDAVDEFLDAAELMEIRAVAGLETRVFVPEWAKYEINSPGEPGVAYHMGVGFTGSQSPAEVVGILTGMRDTARARTAKIVQLVNGFLPEIAIDLTVTAQTLTPSGNVTERHLCEAYRRQAEKRFPEQSALAAFWADKFALPIEEIDSILPDPAAMEALIRSKTMKSGGVGYVQASPESFPTLDQMNNFTRACGALPTIAWLNGESTGESDPDSLLDLHIAKGAAVLNIIPDRNWNFSDHDIRQAKIAQLKRIITAAKERSMPIIVGTEMNAPGLKLVDDFDSEALAPHLEDFVDGAAVVFAHTLLTSAKLGYLSQWAEDNFASAADKYRWYAALGRKTKNVKRNIPKLSAALTPDEIINLVS